MERRRGRQLATRCSGRTGGWRELGPLFPRQPVGCGHGGSRWWFRVTAGCRRSGIRTAADRHPGALARGGRAKRRTAAARSLRLGIRPLRPDLALQARTSLPTHPGPEWRRTDRRRASVGIGRSRARARRRRREAGFSRSASGKSCAPLELPDLPRAAAAHGAVAAHISPAARSGCGTPLGSLRAGHALVSWSELSGAWGPLLPPAPRVYETEFELTAAALLGPGRALWLDLGEVHEMAEVRLNGVDARRGVEAALRGRDHRRRRMPAAMSLEPARHQHLAQPPDRGLRQACGRARDLRRADAAQGSALVARRPGTTLSPAGLLGPVVGQERRERGAIAGEPAACAQSRSAPRVRASLARGARARARRQARHRGSWAGPGDRPTQPRS